MQINPQPAGRGNNAGRPFTRLHWASVEIGFITGTAAYQPLVHFLKRNASGSAENFPGADRPTRLGRHHIGKRCCIGGRLVAKIPSERDAALRSQCPMPMIVRPCRGI